MSLLKNNKIRIVLITLVVLIAAGLVIFTRYRISIKPSEITPVITGQGEIVVACIGDSITYGRGLENREEVAYPTVLQELLGENYTTYNYGYSRRCVTKDADYPYEKEEYYKESLKLNADIYILMLGTNDSKAYNWDADKYERDLTAFVNKYKATGAKEIYLMQPPACFVMEGANKVAYDIEGETVANEIYDIVERVSIATNVNLIDLYTPTKDHSEWFYDGVHPDEVGAAKLAEIISTYIK